MFVVGKVGYDRIDLVRVAEIIVPEDDILKVVLTDKEMGDTGVHMVSVALRILQVNFIVRILSDHLLELFVSVVVAELHPAGIFYVLVLLDRESLFAIQRALSDELVGKGDVALSFSISIRPEPVQVEPSQNHIARLELALGQATTFGVLGHIPKEGILTILVKLLVFWTNVIFFTIESTKSDNIAKLTGPSCDKVEIAFVIRIKFLEVFQSVFSNGDLRFFC